MRGGKSNVDEVVAEGEGEASQGGVGSYYHRKALWTIIDWTMWNVRWVIQSGAYYLGGFEMDWTYGTEMS